MRHVKREAFERAIDATAGPARFKGLIAGCSERRMLETSLREAEAEARRTAERLEAVLDGTQDCVYSLDRELRFTYLNQRARAHFGLLDEVIGRSILEVLPGSERTPFGEALMHLLVEGGSTSLEAYFAPSRRWYEARIAAHADGATIFFRNVTKRKLALDELRASRARAAETLDSIPQMIWVADRDGLCEHLSPQWSEFTGRPVATDLRDGWIEAVHPDDREMAALAWRNSVASGCTLEAEFRLQHRTGEYRWVWSRGAAAHDSKGKIVRWYGTCTDVDERVRAQRAAKRNEELARGILHASPDCMSLLDADGTVIYVNRATLQCYKLDDEGDLVGKRWGSRLPQEYQPLLQACLEKVRAGGTARETIRLPQEDGSDRWWDMVVAPVADDPESPIRFGVISRDVTHQKSSEEKARWAATHDSLTRLPNRSVLAWELDAAIRQAAATGERFALLLLDVDHFKTINDTLGHDAGDALLCSFADRLGNGSRSGDVVARLSGDEFALLVRGVGTEEELSVVVARIFENLSRPFVFKGRILDLAASVGASVYPLHGTTRGVLLKNADVALYSAKAAGRGTWLMFRPDMRTAVVRRAAMINRAKSALEQERIVPHYQPKVEIATGCHVGFEALLRWRDSRNGIRLPATISAAFEDLNLARRITDAMVAAVTQDMRVWLDAGLEFGHVAVNAAAADFRSGDFADRLLETLDRTAIPPRCLQLEVTETVFLGRGAECVEKALKLLSAAGVRIALDDFGTGYASLSHLKQFPVDILKIDRSFVRDLERHADNGAIIDAVISLGRSLGISVVAEGVETHAQHKALQHFGCPIGQGYLYGRAVSAIRAAASIRPFALDEAA